MQNKNSFFKLSFLIHFGIILDFQNLDILICFPVSR